MKVKLDGYSIISADNIEKYEELENKIESSALPVFLDFDEKVTQYWELLVEAFPSFQFFLIDNSSGMPVGRGHCIPLYFNKNWSELPETGFDWVLEKGFLDKKKKIKPNILSALFITISKNHLGEGISYKMLEAMKNIGKQHQFKEMIAPVRPSKKSEYPLIPIEEYVLWKRDDDSPFDPWYRVHVKAGGEMINICKKSMAVSASTFSWKHWTGLEFPGSGSYIVTGALSPVFADIKNGVVSYVEPGLWILHKL